ncbi:tripartite tricarboxylate transporter TctB family protein [Paeniroseomonas aquatica]|uniref:Tripartite tricarboxylate transporter TctB family protein n=1 Tax=Paeniroseomonas aquatica TaxID=373043 RepID=A0ABT8ABT9_9PROT|nr:tripartite tricarboxylate transporter TctB family protein [Paeniroseomonas aquatica]MDN3567272.1 tripartite tricarboxylate transporter TctB family protein [Paeniroseomonas aquatica]
MIRPSAGPSNRAVEIGTALAFTAAGGAALWDSLRLGIGWGTDGPQSGTFPFWIGLALVAASTGTLVQAARTRGELGIFASWPQLRLVASVLVPNILYVAAIPFAGIYVASAVMVAWFMRRLGGFGWARSVLAGIATAVATFVIFEIWFLVALPKGPLETALGY